MNIILMSMSVPFILIGMLSALSGYAPPANVIHATAAFALSIAIWAMACIASRRS